MYFRRRIKTTNPMTKARVERDGTRPTGSVVCPNARIAGTYQRGLVTTGRYIILNYYCFRLRIRPVNGARARLEIDPRPVIIAA